MPQDERFYEQVRELYALAVDYDEDSGETRAFFQLVQNKLHYAALGKTPAELITARADAAKPHMGLTSWSGAEVQDTDVTIARSYLSEEEVIALDALVTLFLDFAEGQARRRRQLFQHDWRTKLDDFLRRNEQDVLQGGGQVTDAFAETFAKEQFALLRK